MTSRYRFFLAPETMAGATMSIVSPVGYSSSTCGYCGAALGERSTVKSSKSYGIWAHRLSPAHYQRLIDRGWRRSGEYVYKPDNARTCCPQLPIRLDAHLFQATKSHRRTLSNLLFNVRTQPKPAKWKGRWSRGRDWNIEQRWDEIEHHPNACTPWADSVAGPFTQRLEVHLQLASSSDEKYQLYRKYQGQIHGEADDKIGSLQSFQRFLVRNSLALTLPSTDRVLNEVEEAQWKQRRFRATELPSELPYGCYHQEYRLDGRLIAVGVLDLLPHCISSVYVFYDPEYSDWQMGKLSALQEIALVRRLSALPSMQSVRYYYMGFYIPSCQKMRYKAEYRPSQLLNCLTNSWHPLTTPLDNTRLQHETDEESDRIPSHPQPPPGMLDPSRLFHLVDTFINKTRPDPQDSELMQLLKGSLVLESKRQHQGCKPLLMSTSAQEYAQEGSSLEFTQALDCIAALADAHLVQQMILFL